MLKVKLTTKDELMSVLKNVTPQNFTNWVAYDIFMELKQKGNLSWVDIIAVVGSVFGEERTSVSRACMQRSFARVKEQRNFFVKYSRHDDLREYMARLWTLPVNHNLNHGRIRRKDQDSIMPEEPKVSNCDTFTGQVQTMSLESLVMDVNNLTDRLNAITQENKILIDRLNKLAQDKESQSLEQID